MINKSVLVACGSPRARRHITGKALLCATTGLVALWAAPSQAQEAAADVQQAEDTGEIIVTGSRIQRSGFTAPTPTTNISSEDLERIAAPNIADALNQLPALRASLTPSTSTNLSTALGGNFLDLRGMGFLRTLTLIDGRRYVPTTTTGAVNISTIPQALIAGTDVVTGGASAAYGSDAVAGVVNLRLNNTLEGVKGSIQGGITDHNDHRNYLASAAFGTYFAGGRGHLLVGGEAAQNSGVDKMSDRGWGDNPSVIFNPAYALGNGQPQYLVVDDARSSNASFGGVINSVNFAGGTSGPGPLRGIQFAPDGTPIPFTYGTSVTATTMNGGDGVPSTADLVLETPVKRYSGFGRLSYEVTDDIKVFAEFAYGRTESSNLSILGNDQLTIQADNAYLPESIRSTMAANNITSFVMGRSLKDYGRGGIDVTTDTWQVTGGAEGSFSDTWKWNAYYGFGKTHNLALFTGNRITAYWRQSMDAVFHPDTGSIVCRSSIADPTNGCVPMNLIGEGNVTQQAKDYILGTAVRDWKVKQRVAAFTINGEPFSTWAGPVSLAFGGEYRKQSVDVTSDPMSMAGAFRVGNAQPWYGKVNVKEGFAELLVPLAADQSWAKAIDLNLAGRITDYSTSGTVKTWKIGATYDVSDSIRFRATRSRDIRAPNLDEMFAAGNTFIFGINDPILGTNYSVQNIQGGNPDLKPERADTLTLGVVFTPTFFPRFRMSVDYYDIDLKGAINSLSTGAIVQRCYTDTPALCSLITRPTPTSNITVIRSSPANFQSIKARGFDIEVGYGTPLFSGNLDLRALANYTDTLDLVDGVNTTHFAGNTELISINGVGGTPHWRFTTSAAYTTDAFKLALTGRYVGGGKITQNNDGLPDDNQGSTDKQKVNGRLYLDISGEVTLIDDGNRRVALFGTIQNLTDNDPPITAYNGYGTTRSLYDMIGRVYNAGVRFKF
ncbi:TonB-dependent receptor [uncultured Sphingosinicella sp.]|uniref:TonB-dependent receptor plug domain-containing protein n=1 Tax=uncultured Sphingosinicella sp. TaxID=478748 RepID=UPI0030DD23C8|tara:strand:+ start:13106 stop:15952 length:2847 start_codon:yes stop_codon:yes gene_type:complete